MRAFIATELVSEIRMRLAEVRDRGWVSGRSVRWVKTDQMHVTLKFFKEIPYSAVSDVTSAIQIASEGFGPFELEVIGLGFFPDARRPRVYWAGIQDVEGALSKLYEKLGDALEDLGFGRETRPFKPHLTLARFRGKADRLPPAGEGEDEFFGSQTVNEIVLFKSELRPQGPLYTPLSAVRLKE